MGPKNSQQIVKECSIYRRGDTFYANQKHSTNASEKKEDLSLSVAV